MNKAGIKTTEFWLTLIVSGLGTAVLLGYMPKEIADQAQKGVEQIIGGIMTLAPVIAYIISRGITKSRTITEVKTTVIDTGTQPYGATKTEEKILG